MLGQTVPSMDSSNREGPITDGGQPCMADIQRQWESRLKASLSLKISCVLELIGEIRWCCPVQTLVHENSELELDPIQCSQPVQLLEERRDVVIPRGREHESCRRVQERLELLEKVWWNASSQGCIAVVQSWQDEWWHPRLENRSGKWPTDTPKLT